MATQMTFAEAARAKRLGGSGTLTAADLRDFTAAQERILRLLADGRWHSSAEILAAAGQQCAMRRLGELRERLNIESRRRPGSRTWEYKLQQFVDPTDKEMR